MDVITWVASPGDYSEYQKDGRCWVTDEPTPVLDFEITDDYWKASQIALAEAERKWPIFNPDSSWVEEFYTLESWRWAPEKLDLAIDHDHAFRSMVSIIEFRWKRVRRPRLSWEDVGYTSEDPYRWGAPGGF